MEHWYVYYKLPAAELDATLPAMRALIAAVARNSGIDARLQTRVDRPDGIVTVMEVYPEIAAPAQFGDALNAALSASDLPGPLRSGRRTERFRSL